MSVFLGGIAPEIKFAADSLLEGGGFEPSVPRLKDLCKQSSPSRENRGSRAPENGDMAQSLRHSKRVERFRDAAGDNSGCEVALQVLGSLPVTSSRPFTGESR
jgi:hypothetical protein